MVDEILSFTCVLMKIYMTPSIINSQVTQGDWVGGGIKSVTKLKRQAEQGLKCVWE